MISGDLILHGCVYVCAQAGYSIGTESALRYAA